MPAFIHDRAQHLLAKNPKMSKSQAFAIATQQSHALGKSPKGYGTKQGKQEAKAKYDKPRKEYVKTPNPGKLETPKLKDRKKEAEVVYKALQSKLAFAAMRDELMKIADDKEKEALFGKLFSGLAKNAPVSTAALGEGAAKGLSTGAVKARGVTSQMAKNPNRFGGAAVDPFVAMRK